MQLSLIHNDIRFILNVVCYFILPVALVSFFIFMPSMGIFLFAGKVAKWMLIVILFASPINAIWGNLITRHILVFRRQLGVAIVWLALFHGVGFSWEYGLWSLDYFLGWDNYYLYGFLALVLLIVLGITSNTLAVRLLKRYWKKVQYLSYGALILALVHSGMAEGELVGTIVLSAIFVVLKIGQRHHGLMYKLFRMEGFLGKG